MRIGIEIPLDLDMLETDLTPFPVAGNDGSDNFLGLLYRVDVEALEEWASVNNFMMGDIWLGQMNTFVFSSLVFDFSFRVLV